MSKHLFGYMQNNTDFFFKKFYHPSATDEKGYWVKKCIEYIALPNKLLITP